MFIPESAKGMFIPESAKGIESRRGPMVGPYGKKFPVSFTLTQAAKEWIYSKGGSRFLEEFAIANHEAEQSKAKSRIKS